MKKIKGMVLIFVVVIIAMSTFLYVQNAHRKNIATELMNEYLNKNKVVSVNENNILLDYKINEITIIENNMSGFVFSVVYSVKPEKNKLYWIAGTGEIRNNGWIENKYQEVTVVKVNGKYIIKSMGIA